MVLEQIRINHPLQIPTGWTLFKLWMGISVWRLSYGHQTKRMFCVKMVAKQLDKAITSKKWEKLLPRFYTRINHTKLWKKGPSARQDQTDLRVHDAHDVLRRLAASRSVVEWA